MNKFRELAGLGLLVVVCSVTQASTPLHSPWDNKPIQATDSAYACPAVAHVPQNLTMDGFYRIDDPTHSIIDPVRMEAYRQASEPVKKVGLNDHHLKGGGLTLRLKVACLRLKPLESFPAESRLKARSAL